MIKLFDKLFLTKRILSSEIVASFMKKSLQLLKSVINDLNFKGFICASITFIAKLILVINF